MPSLMDYSMLRAGASVEVPDFIWSPDGLGIQAGSVECLVMSLIWSVTKDNLGYFADTQGNIAARFNVSRKAVNEALRDLVDRGYVDVVGVIGNPRTGVRKYAINRGAVGDAIMRMAGYTIDMTIEPDGTVHRPAVAVG